jgi:hypothetical protein
VGFTQGSTGQPTLAETWNGTSWTIKPAPSPGYRNFLESVSCTSASACTAAEVTINPNLTTVLNFEAWNGTKWAIQPAPNPGGASTAPSASLVGVSCVSATTCTAAGDYYKGSGYLTLAEAE